MKTKSMKMPTHIQPVLKLSYPIFRLRLLKDNPRRNDKSCPRNSFTAFLEQRYEVAARG